VAPRSVGLGESLRGGRRVLVGVRADQEPERRVLAASDYLPELGDRATPLCAQTIMVVGAVWTHARPSAAMLDAYDADPALAALRMDFATTLQDMLAILVAGNLARTAVC
jgi:hypothetical protein